MSILYITNVVLFHFRWEFIDLFRVSGVNYVMSTENCLSCVRNSVKNKTIATKIFAECLLGRLMEG